MKRLAVLSLCGFVAMGVAASAMLVTHDVSAQAKKAPAKSAKKKGDPAAKAGPVTPIIKSKTGILLTPTGLHWGMSPQQVMKFYDRVIDKDYVPLYQKAQAGPEMERLDAAVAGVKDAFRRSRVDFGALPTGVDATPLKGEYSYQNGESMMTINRRGAGARHFFFMKDRLWKIYDEIPVGEKRPMGPTFETAIKKLSTRYAVAGRVTEPDYLINRNYTEVDWQDDKSRVRAVDRTGMKIIGLVYEDRSVLDNLSSFRTAKPIEVGQVDPEIEALIRTPSAPAGPPKGEEDKGKEKSKKGKK